MKRLVIISSIFLALLLCNQAFSQDFHTANQSTIGWNAVTNLTVGDPIPAGDTIEYKLYLSNADTDPSKTNPAEVATVSETESTITLNVEGRFFVGVKAVRTVQASGTVKESTISWSDDAAVCKDGITFGIQYFHSPEAPNGIYIVVS